MFVRGWQRANKGIWFGGTHKETDILRLNPQPVLFRVIFLYQDTEKIDESCQLGDVLCKQRPRTHRTVFKFNVFRNVKFSFNGNEDRYTPSAMTPKFAGGMRPSSPSAGVFSGVAGLLSYEQVAIPLGTFSVVLRSNEIPAS
jgi:hypothetical protein